jgi:RNA polymerase sigma-70 factor (ECF subfamily)
VQEALLSAYRALPQFRAESSFSTCLFRILINACRMRLRRVQSHRELSIEELGLAFDPSGRIRGEVPGWPTTPEQAALDKELVEVVRRGLRELPAGYREVLALVDMGDMINLEAAEAVEVSVSALKARLHRARLYLLNKLAGYFSEASM